MSKESHQIDTQEQAKITSSEIENILDEKVQNLTDDKEIVTRDSLNRIYRKVDKRLIPCLWSVYFFAFSAKSIIGIALTMNVSEGHSLKQTLNLLPQQVSTGITLFYIAYVIFEIPCNLMTIYISPRFWISKTLLVVGIVLFFYTYMKDLVAFYILRFLLGVAEAGLWPGMAYYLMNYYPPYIMGKRIGWYFTASQISTMTIGFLSIGFQKMDGIANLEGYKCIATIIVGVVTMWLLPQTLTEASVTEEELHSPSFIVRMYKRIKKTTERPFLTEDEKQLLLSNISLKNRWKVYDLVAAFIDPRIWLLIFMYFGGMAFGIGIKNYGSLIIRSLDTEMSSLKISLLYAIVWIVNLIGVLIILPASDHYRSRMSFYISCSIVIIIGILILTYAHNKWLQYSGLLISIFATGPLIPICMAWCAQIFSKETKLNVAATSALLTGMGNLGSIFTSYTLYEGMPGRDGYKKSNIVLCVVMGMSIIASLSQKALLMYYSKETN
ncbi:unnamed protein product [Pneumocystis jirovecii]|uniref:Major facilitator superfamily (MFS) profile domain-containing protein n=1 Tax=Pneumocystis jirovecii TaxID=42068 RepID=L0P8P4_PNEJI|nr:unnamed protein product [Pneumocystis jirovecii]